MMKLELKKKVEETITEMEKHYDALNLEIAKECNTTFVSFYDEMAKATPDSSNEAELYHLLNKMENALCSSDEATEFEILVCNNLLGYVKFLINDNNF